MKFSWEEKGKGIKVFGVEKNDMWVIREARNWRCWVMEDW
jgi:hypothetical protein